MAFGCSVGWGAFVMPGNTFLPVAGPVGTAYGIGFGALAMLVIGANYHYLMNRFPEERGGVYAYTRNCFGYDHGFVSGWFLLLTYMAVLWANATALPLIARTVLGGRFQFGFLYEIAGYPIYLGEIMLAEGALLIAAFLCLRRRLAERTQIVLALALLIGTVICFAAAMGTDRGAVSMVSPPFETEGNEFVQVFTIISLAPWAFVGFESISHSTPEAAFPVRHSIRIMSAAVTAAAAAYILLVFLAASAQPEGFSSWRDYVAGLGSCRGVASQPAFFAARSAMGGAGLAVLGIAALGGIGTGLVGNYVALSRLLSAMAEDEMVPQRFGETDEKHVPRRAILTIMAISLLLPFLGRTAISWIVDVTTVGATIAYVYASAAAWKTAWQEDHGRYLLTAAAGVALALVFVIEFLIPNIIGIKTLSMESYFILAAWGLLGLLCFRHIFQKDRKRRYGRNASVWAFMLAMIIFSSTVWMLQETGKEIDNSVEPIQSYYTDRSEEAGENAGEESETAYLTEVLVKVKHTQLFSGLIQVMLIVAALVVVMSLYYGIQKRERQTEIEKALAEDASRAKTSFLSNMSHEIRTPMNAIIGLDNIALRNPDLQPETREQLEKIGTSARHLLGLINDILDMSRIESGRMALKNEEFSFREFLEQINIIISGQCADKGLQYSCRIIGETGDYYIGDDMKLKQVLINILGNAVKFTEAPGTVTLTVEQISEAEDLCTLRFTMSDTGIGMDREYIPRIFEAFSQEDATTTNRYGGSGLGMAITKNFVEMMGGEIDVQSEKGAGSVFTVKVGLKRSPRRDEEDHANVLPEEQEEMLPDEKLLAGRRVLMAEDVDQNAEILEDLLSLEDIEAERAANGSLAVEMVSSHPPGYYDAILMDMRMPVMDGLDATRAIRALDHPDARTIPIIAMTANVFDEDVRNTLEAGMNAHLAKPIEPELMYRTLARLITGHGKENAEGNAHAEDE